MNRKLKSEELARKSKETFKLAPKMPVVVVLDNIRSGHNVGAVFRTSDAFLAERVVLCGITARPPHRNIQKTALGATESVSWTYFDHTLQAVHSLKKLGYVVLSVEQAERSVKLPEYIPVSAKKYALVFGHEVTGVQQEVVSESDGSIEIPQSGTKHSLNLSVCAGIVLWHFYNKMIPKPEVSFLLGAEPYWITC